MKVHQIKKLRISDFKFEFISRENKERCQEIKQFILDYEWLGKMPHRPTHRFIATYRGKLAGVIIMATPNAFSHLLGKENRNLEKLISRGACASWTPKNLASSLIMYSINWMVQNTSFRYFTAYSDVEARELGTIYQACNFTYLGQKSGARFEYFDPNNPDKGWFSDRLFRKTTSYKIYAKKAKIFWHKNWSTRDKINWDLIPHEIIQKIKTKAKEHQKSCVKRPLPKKHKYVYILGKDRRETKRLRNIFSSLNPKISNLIYPKKRGV